MSKLEKSVHGQRRRVRFGAAYSVDVLSIRTLYGKTTIPVLVVKQGIKMNSTQCKMIDTDKLGKTEQARDQWTSEEHSPDKAVRLSSPWANIASVNPLDRQKTLYRLNRLPTWIMSVVFLKIEIKA